MNDTIISTFQQEADLAYAQLKIDAGKKLSLREDVNAFELTPHNGLVTFFCWYPGDRSPEHTLELSTLRTHAQPASNDKGSRFRDVSGFANWRDAERRLSWALAQEELARLDVEGGRP